MVSAIQQYQYSGCKETKGTSMADSMTERYVLQVVYNHGIEAVRRSRVGVWSAIGQTGMYCMWHITMDITIVSRNKTH